MSRSQSQSFGVLRYFLALFCCLLLGVPATAGTYSKDDGVSENDLGGGPPHPADLWWAQGFTVQPGCELITSIEIAFGNMPDGLNVQLLLYDDPTNDLNPSDAVLLTSTLTTSMFSNTDTFVSVPITPTTVSGDFFVGALTSNTSTQFPLALDQTMSAMSLWVAENTNGVGTIDPMNVGGTSTFGPALADSVGFPGNALIRATGVPEPGTSAMVCLGWSVLAQLRKRRPS